MKNNLDIRFFQVFDSNKTKDKRQEAIIKTVSHTVSVFKTLLVTDMYAYKRNLRMIIER